VTRARWAVLAAAAVGVSVWLLVAQFGAIWPNLAASVIWGTPALITHHLLIRRRIDGEHEARAQEAHARHLEHRARLDAIGRQVEELHRFHVHGELPDDALRPWRHRDEPAPAEPAN